MKALNITINALSWIAAGLILWAFYPLLMKGFTLANRLHNAPAPMLTPRACVAPTWSATTLRSSASPA